MATEPESTPRPAMTMREIRQALGHNVQPNPEPRQTRRDVSWAVMIRLTHSSVWLQWSDGHRTPGEAADDADQIRTHPGVAEVRCDRVIHQRDMFSQDDLTSEVQR